MISDAIAAICISPLDDCTCRTGHATLPSRCVDCQQTHHRPKNYKRGPISLFFFVSSIPHSTTSSLLSYTHTHTQILTPKTKFKTKTKFKMTQYNLPVPTKASSDVLSQATKSTDSTFVLHYFGLHARSKLIQYLLASADAK